jgi:hypothetical protein
MADMMERNALVNAQGNASQVEILVNQAMRASPPPRGVQPIGRIDIARGFVAIFIFIYIVLISFPHSSLLSDVFFDNIFTDMAFHSNYLISFFLEFNSFIFTLKTDKIKQSAAQVVLYNQRVRVHSLPWP